MWVMSDSSILCTVALQASLFMGFFIQEYWKGFHALIQGIFPIQGWNPHLLSPTFASGFFATSATSSPNNNTIHISINLQILFPDRLLQHIGYGSLYYIVSPYWLSILCIITGTGYFLITHPHHLWEKGNNTVIQYHDFLKSVLKQYIYLLLQFPTSYFANIFL